MSRKTMLSKRNLGLILAGVLLVSQVSHADWIDTIFGAGKFGRTASPMADKRCIISRIIDNTRFWKDKTWKSRVVVERKPKFLSDREFMEELRFSNERLGLMDTQYLKEFDTRFYYTATAKARPDGTIPMVDPEAKALVIYLHGSGTSKASGANFAGKANALAKMNYAVVSFDLPFHADGTRNPNLAKTEVFSAYLDSIVKHLGNPGQPVYIIGHSFGPDLIAEFATRYPHGMNGAVLMSPGGFDKVTQQWFEEKTVYMVKIFGEVEENNEGARWAGLVTSDNIWNDLTAEGRKDPTQVNKDLRLLLVSGEKEEYLPGELDAEGIPTDKPRDYDIGKFFRERFKNIEVNIVPKTGHYIFQAVDEHGQDIVLSSVLKLDGVSMKDEAKALKAAYQKVQQTRTPIDYLVLRNQKEPFFREWLDREARREGLESGKALIDRVMAEGDKKAAQKLVSTYNMVEKQRFEALDAHIRSTAQWAPAFYEENKASIEKLGDRSFDATGVRSKYLTLLQSMDKTLAESHSVATEDVFKIQEKPVRKPGSLEGSWVAVESFFIDMQHYFRTLYERVFN